MSWSRQKTAHRVGDLSLFSLHSASTPTCSCCSATIELMFCDYQPVIFAHTHTHSDSMHFGSTPTNRGEWSRLTLRLAWFLASQVTFASISSSAELRSLVKGSGTKSTVVDITEIEISHRLSRLWPLVVYNSVVWVARVIRNKEIIVW